jgi:hypothetical protein
MEREIIRSLRWSVHAAAAPPRRVINSRRLKFRLRLSKQEIATSEMGQRLSCAAKILNTRVSHMGHSQQISSGKVAISLASDVAEGTETMRIAVVVLLVLGSLLLTRQSSAQPVEYIGQPVRGIPVSSAVRVGKSYLCLACQGSTAMAN